MSIFKRLLLLALFMPTMLKPDIEFDELDDFDFTGRDEHITRSSFNKVNVYDYLVDLVPGNLLLAEDFYKETYFLNKRPIYTSPIFLSLHTEQLYQNRAFNVSAFYNETSKVKYTKNSEAISSYIKIGPDEGFIPVFRDQVNEDVKEQVGLSIPQTAGLFTGAKVQQRRAGFMLQFLKSFDRCTVEISTPLMYQERNYFFSEQEQKNIRDQFGEADKDEIEKLTRAHFVADKLGLGDTRIKISRQFAEREKFCGRIGAQITLPTGFAFKNGLYGSQFRKDVMDRPTVNLCKIIEKAQDETQKDLDAAAQLGMDFGFNTIDWMSAILLDTPMGNNKHFGIGGFLETSFNMARFIKLDSVASLEYIIPRYENRFYIKKKNPALFADSRFPKNLDEDDPDDLALATNRVAFLNEQAAETFFPMYYKSFVSPGFMFQFTVGPKISIRDWTFNFGYDFWIRQKETINPILGAPVEPLVLSEKPHCYQNKIFASARFNKISEHHDWSFCLSAEHTPSSRGIGQDLTASLGFQINF